MGSVDDKKVVVESGDVEASNKEQPTVVAQENVAVVENESVTEKQAGKELETNGAATETKPEKGHLSEAEKRKLRAERFGIVKEGGNDKGEQGKSENEKPAGSLQSASEAEKKKLRAEKFGLASSAKGNNAPAVLAKINAAVKAASTANAGKLSAELEKRKARSERFGVDLNAPEVVAWKEKAQKLGLNEKAISNVLAGKETKGKVTTTDSKEKGLLKSPVNPSAGLLKTAGGLSEAELAKRKQRADRFGLSAAENGEKKRKSSEFEAASLISAEKKAKRLERFGAEAVTAEVKKPATAEAADKVSEVTEPPKKLTEEELLEREKKKKRAERFGLPLGDPAEVAAKRRERAEKFTPLISNANA